MARTFDDAQLDVLLGDVPVGTLRRTKNDAVEFLLLESYKTARLQPVLGQQFLDDPDKLWRVNSRVPAWFSNLLPEGALKQLIAQQAGVHVQREFFLLRQLGQDLPGAVRILSSQAELALMSDVSADEQTTDEEKAVSDWHFSLAGVQLKFSARENERGLTIPVSGAGGDWIVKLPDARYESVPLNEYATMQWAKASGIEVPTTRLLAIEDIDGLPKHLYRGSEKTAYAIRRFDRKLDGARVHMEDFAQVLGLYPEDKYDHFNYETIAGLVTALDGERGLRALVHQLVFMIASGNGDAHHKNWSLLYPDGVSARLSPAYDLVSTIQYNADDRMALNLGRSRAWEDMSLHSFERLARKIDWPESAVRSMAEEAVQRIRDVWSKEGENLGYDKAARARLKQHMCTIPLMRV